MISMKASVQDIVFYFEKTYKVNLAEIVFFVEGEIEVSEGYNSAKLDPVSDGCVMVYGLAIRLNFIV